MHFLKQLFKYRHFLGGMFSQKIHAISSSSFASRYKINTIPALRDNYMYVIMDNEKNTAIAIDPVEPDKVLSTIEFQGSKLIAVLTTHHHLDHAGGNLAISKSVKNLPIYGGDDRVEALNKKVTHNSIIRIGDLSIKCLHTPCHTRGHICYYIEDSTTPICFTGDTLFVSGCGRFFEGTAENMLNSLTILSELPPKTKFFCGHEYTVSNLKFALSIEPDNVFTKKKLNEVEDKLSKSEPSVPSTIGEELSYNPFMRVNISSVQKYTRESDPVAVMAALRKLKDNF